MGLGLGFTSTLVSHRDIMVEEDSEKPHPGDTLANSLVDGKLGLKPTSNVQFLNSILISSGKKGKTTSSYVA